MWWQPWDQTQFLTPYRNNEEHRLAPTNPILSSLSFSLFDRPLVSPSQFEFHSLFAFELWAHWLSFTGRSPWARRRFCLQPTEEEPSKLADGLSPGARPLVCQTAIPRCKPQPLALSLNSTLGTADGLVCNSSFVWNQPMDFTLRTVRGSWNAQPLWLHLVQACFVPMAFKLIASA